MRTKTAYRQNNNLDIPPDVLPADSPDKINGAEAEPVAAVSADIPPEPELAPEPQVARKP